MVLKVTPRRSRGKALSQQDVQRATAVLGDMVVVHVMSDEFNRYSNVAQFQQSAAAKEQPLPELHDATLSWMGPNGFVLTGIETISGVSYAQSWWCRLPD